MRLIGNILWLLLAGLWLAIGYVVAGVVLCLTVIGIPFGVQSFKLAGYALAPFGRVVVDEGDRGSGCLTTVGNVLWIVLAGIWLAIGHVVTGLLLCLTIIGIPFGIANIKMAALALAPFGKTIVSLDDLEDSHRVVARMPAAMRPR
ncbi:MAG: YccF domain-containing protein [Acidimicrobiales bacterium]|jgi:uncharacterized membrane protein YccF (DUF307 family)|nr:YccF domain-containing protein [Acidimicrobiales bacterium]